MRVFHVPRPRLGLLKQVEQLKAASEAMLFPKLSFDAKNGPAGRTQHAFSRYLVELGIKARSGGRLGHQSFRDTVIGALKAAGVHREMREQYTSCRTGRSMPMRMKRNSRRASWRKRITRS